MHYLPEAAQTHRDVGQGWRGVQLQVQSLMLPIEGCYSLRPDGGNVVPIMELPVKREDPVEIQGQAAAVIHHHTQLLPLQGGGHKGDNRVRQDSLTSSALYYIHLMMIARKC